MPKQKIEIEVDVPEGFESDHLERIQAFRSVQQRAKKSMTQSDQLRACGTCRHWRIVGLGAGICGLEEPPIHWCGFVEEEDLKTAGSGQDCKEWEAQPDPGKEIAE